MTPDELYIRVILQGDRVVISGPSNLNIEMMKLQGDIAVLLDRVLNPQLYESTQDKCSSDFSEIGMGLDVARILKERMVYGVKELKVKDDF